MKHLVWWLIRHDRLPRSRHLRRLLLRSIFTPTPDDPRDGDGELAGWYDLGPDVSPADARRFRDWAWRDE